MSELKCVLLQRHSCLTVVHGHEQRTFFQEFDPIRTPSSLASGWNAAASMNRAKSYEKGHEFEVADRAEWKKGKVRIIEAPDDFVYTIKELPAEPVVLQVEEPALPEKEPEMKEPDKPKSASSLLPRTKQVLDAFVQLDGKDKDVPVQDVLDVTGLALNQVMAEVLVLECKRLIEVKPGKNVRVLSENKTALPEVKPNVRVISENKTTLPDVKPSIEDMNL